MSERKIIRRLDKMCKSATTNCPAVFEFDDGDFAIIGTHTPALASRLPADAGVDAHETIVTVPRHVLLAAFETLKNLENSSR